MKDGTLIHDFLFRRSLRRLDVCNTHLHAATIPTGVHLTEWFAALVA